MSEVEPWNGWKLIKAQMTLQADGSTKDVLDAVATGLNGSGFKVKDRSDQGFKAVFTNKLLLLDLTLQRTTLMVQTEGGGDGAAQVAVRVVAGGSHSSGGTHAAKGLSSAVRSLEDRGLRVTTTPWAAIGG